MTYVASSCGVTHASTSSYVSSRMGRFCIAWLAMYRERGVEPSGVIESVEKAVY
jgi:hypothetical protein